eukprot:2870812-Rhodomonas_salina.4
MEARRSLAAWSASCPHSHTCIRHAHVGGALDTLRRGGGEWEGWQMEAEGRRWKERAAEGRGQPKQQASPDGRCKGEGGSKGEGEGRGRGARRGLRRAAMSASATSAPAGPRTPSRPPETALQKPKNQRPKRRVRCEQEQSLRLSVDARGRRGATHVDENVLVQAVREGRPRLPATRTASGKGVGVDLWAKASAEHERGTGGHPTSAHSCKVRLGTPWMKLTRFM